MSLRTRIKSAFGYDAVIDKQRRRPPSGSMLNEDDVLKAGERRKLVATTQDLRRNYSVAAWAIRKHLDFVSDFRFDSRTDNGPVDEAVEAFYAKWSRRENCDIRRMHSFGRLVRLAEGHRVVDGDFGWLHLPNGRIQSIEGDRIATPTLGVPTGVNIADFVQGIRTAKITGEPLAYCLCDRSTYGSRTYRAIVPARAMTVAGYYDRIDQMRGISPLASALNTFQDTLEANEYNLLKVKVAAMFGLAMFRDDDRPAGDVGTEEDDDGNIDHSRKTIDMGGGLKALDMGMDDRVEMVESKTPATETREFMKLMISIALKALDIPFSMFDESFTNFYGSRGGVNAYLKSAEAKQEGLFEATSEVLLWRFRMAEAAGELVLPGSATVDDLRWDLVPAGVPWWDASKEIVGHLRAIAGGLGNPQNICRQTGSDYYDNIDRIAEAKRYAKSKGVDLTWQVVGAGNGNQAAKAAKQKAIDE